MTGGCILQPLIVKYGGAERGKMKFEKYFDHTILNSDAKAEDVVRVCDEAKEHGFASVCVNSCYTELVKNELSGTEISVCVVVGFPLGACMGSVKAFEAREAVMAGADEIDMVINVGALKAGRDEEVLNDIKLVREACEGKVLKVIIETCLLSDEEKERACELAVKAGADFVKTSTGFGKGGATLRDVALIKKIVGDRIKVKASGGIRDYHTAIAMIEAGADRLGTSATVKIVAQRANS